jgi:hypothetical protein
LIDYETNGWNQPLLRWNRGSGLFLARRGCVGIKISELPPPRRGREQCASFAS